MDDADFMRAAMALARQGWGETAPNPTVGCVIVRGGRVVGRGRTAPGGRPHAETAALLMAGAAAVGATAYITLEPCAHQGKTPPCTEALIAAGITRVVVATRDPDPRVNGRGISLLRDAGIQVVEGLGAAVAEAINEGFFSVIRHSRPMVTLKLATTLDGRIATRSGESRWITGEFARRVSHALRGTHDAVMVGVGTVLADDPELTCRLGGFRLIPLVRIIVDSHLRTPLDGRLIRSLDRGPIWLLHRDGVDPHRRQAFTDLGVRLIELPAAPIGLDIRAGLVAIAHAGITRLLVEGGSSLSAALLRADLIDRLAWFTAPLLVGGDGLPAVAGFGVDALPDAKRFVLDGRQIVGADRLAFYRRIT